MVPLSPPTSRSAITPVFCLSHLISFCHLCAGALFPITPPVPFSLPLFPAFYGALHSTCHVSLLRFYPSSCRSLNPLSFALPGPFFLLSLPVLAERFFFRALSHFHLHLFGFPSFLLIHFLSAICSIYPSLLHLPILSLVS